jgi:hypothetical protein
MELAAYTRAFRPDDVAHKPATYADREGYRATTNGH